MIRGGVVDNEHDGGLRITGGSVTGRPVPTPGLDHRVDALPWDGRGDIRGYHRHQRKKYPDHWRIPPALHLEALNGLGGGPGMILGPGYHCIRVPQRRY